MGRARRLSVPGTQCQHGGLCSSCAQSVGRSDSKMGRQSIDKRQMKGQLHYGASTAWNTMQLSEK